MTALARFCYRRRRWVLLLWIVGAVAIVYVGFGFGAPADNDFSGGKSDSGQAARLLKDHFPKLGDTITLAVHSDAGIADPATKARVQALIGQLGHGPHVAGVTSPYDAPQQISRDGHTAFAPLQLDVSSDKMSVANTKILLAEAKKASGGGVKFAMDGGAVQTAETPYGGPTEGFGILAAMVVLLIAFGSLPAMGLPVATALFGIASGLGLTDLLGYIFPAPSFSPIVAGLIGFGVGVDYALFIVTRYREGLEHGMDPEEATVTALRTAGRSVVFAGVTVVVAMLGLLVMQQRLLTATAIAAAVAVLMTMIAATTLLPALLGFTGRSINRFRLPLLGRTRTTSPLAQRWAGVVQRRPVISLVAAALTLIVLAIPALSMRLSFEDSSNQLRGSSGYTAHQMLANGFGAGYDAPLVAVSSSPAGLDQVVAAVRRTPGVASVTPPRTSPDGKAAVFIAYPTTAQQDPATPKLVHTLRDSVLPRTVHLGGPNAGTVDFAQAVGVRLPWLVALTIGIALLILLILVRSVVIAVKAALMTLLSVGVAYGVITAIAQWGWLARPLGFSGAMPITTWVPLFLFPILFGLSTDYEVFLIARIREEYDGGLDTREAVTAGLARTARVITAAAAIMALVFLSVFLGADAAVKQFGLGLAVAVIVDATIVRMVLVPALMELLGKWNWWLPSPLARLMPAVE